MVHLYAGRRIVDRAGAARVVAGNNDLARLPARPIASHTCAGRRAAAGRLVVVFQRPLKQRSHALTRCPIAVNELHASNIRRALPIVHAFHTADRNSTQFQLFAAKTVKLEQRSNFLGSGYGLVNGLVTTAGLALVLYVGGIRVLSGSIPLGTLLVFVAYVGQMQGATGGLIDIFTKLKAAQASVDALLEVLHAEDTIREVPNPRPLKINHSKSTRIEFDNVTFGYDAGRAVLQNVSLTAEPGQMIALVGPTGPARARWFR